jgi:DNA-binding beta-propeller fold protein YncE
MQMLRAIFSGFLLAAAAQAADPLQFERAIALAGVEGRIDHMSADVKNGRLFVSALANKTLEVLDWNAGTSLKSVPGLNEPQGVLYSPDNNRLYVATRGDGNLTILDGDSFQVLKTLNLGANADNVRLEHGKQIISVGYGSGSLGAFDSDGQQLTEIKLGAHPESFQLEGQGSRIFVNLPGSKNVAVIDRKLSTIPAKWGTGFDFSNFPMALVEESKRLFVVCRLPARVLVFNTETGKIVTTFSTVGDSDDAFYDAARHRLYVIGGEGAIAVYDQTAPDRYAQLTRITTAPGARTGLFVPDANRLFLAVPHRDAQKAEVRVYKVN